MTAREQLDLACTAIKHVLESSCPVDDIEGQVRFANESRGLLEDALGLVEEIRDGFVSLDKSVLTELVDKQTGDKK